MQVFATRKIYVVTKAFFKKHSQAVKAMKLIGIILFIASLHLSARGLTQTITISVKDATLDNVFKLIEKQTDYVFLFEKELIAKSKKVTLNVSKPLLDVLDLCFKDQPFTYHITGKIIALAPRKDIPLKESKSSTEVQNPLIDLRGRVVNSEGDPIEGATVSVKGGVKSTVTNARGEFFLNAVDDNAVLTITSVGYQEELIQLNGRTSINAVLKIKITSLDELQVIGYGQTTKRLNTGNVATIKSSDIEKQPVQNPLLALQGRVPGLFIVQPSGLAGSSIKVQIQGQNSIASGNNPLYVIDGVPIVSDLPMTGIDGVLGPTGPNYSGNGNPLNYINISDIESIEILKDADATSIYGSRAANGVILITTKKGKVGPMRLNVNFQTGWGREARKLDMLDTRRYLDMRYEAFRNDGVNWKSPFVSANDLKVWDTTRYTDWQKKLIGNTAKYNDVNATVSGGTQSLQYLIGATYHRETTVFPISDDFADTKISVNSNLTTSSNDQKFKLQLSSSFMTDKNQLPRFDLTQSALLLEPDAPDLYNPDGTINWASNASGTSTFQSNPMINTVAKYWNKTNNLISNLVLSYKILSGLEIKSSMGYNKLQTDDFRGFPLIAAAPERRLLPGTQRMAEYGNRDIHSLIIEPQLSYRKDILKGKMELLIGGTYLNQQTNVHALSGTGYLSDDLLENINAAANISNLYAFESDYKYNAGFARLNYNWKDRYIINLTARRDGSSRFGKESQLHNFGSIGGAWLFYNETFIKAAMPFISFGKIKGSYGTTGNDQIGDYRFLSLFNYPPIQVPYQGIVSITPAGLPNPHLQWEETRKLQVGLDLGFLNDRFLLNITYVRNRSANQLLDYQVPSVTGFLSYLSNFPAIIQNRNWEMSLSSKNISTKHFNWTTSINLTIPQNKLVAFPNLSASSYANLLVVGKPVTIQKLLHYIGVDPTTGKYFYESKTDPFNPKFPDDYTTLLNIDPKYYGGLDNTITYKQIELDFLFQFVKQTGYNDVTFWNGNRTPGSFYEGLSNQTVAVLNRWQQSGDLAPVAKFSSYNNFLSPIISSNFRYTDASYVRLKNVSLSWSLPDKSIKKIGLKRCRIYVHGQNLWTITNYKGLDPENKSILTPTLPPLRVITVGVQLGI